LYLSFFVKGKTRPVKEIGEILKEVGFPVREECEKHNIVIFEGKGGLSCASHKFLEEAPSCVCSPFLVKAGEEWNIEGLANTLKGYLRFDLPYLEPEIFPREGDFLKSATKDKVTMKRLSLIEGTVRNCEEVNFSHQRRKMREIRKVAEKGSSAGEVKMMLLLFLLKEQRIALPWGSPPTGRGSSLLLMDWLRMANEAFPREKSGGVQQFRDYERIKRLERYKEVKLI